MKNKKTKIAIIAVIALVLVTIGITYAYWLITRTQEGENVITTGCLDIALTDGADDITLTDQFPMSDEDGANLTPYTFTVTNNCNTSVDYQVALEAIDVADKEEISSSALKVSLNDTAKLYSAYSEVATTVSGAYESRRLIFSRLAASGSEGATDSYSLRIWIDEDAPISEMNKTFTSKITVTVGQGIESPFEEGTLAYSILSNYGVANASNELNATFEHTITTTGNSYISASSNYYYGTSYVYNESTKKYTLDGTLVQATLEECRAGQKSDGTVITCGKYTLKGNSSTYSYATLYEITDFQESGDYVTANVIQYLNEFGIETKENEATLNKAQDDLGDSYYYRGDVKDNYVQFGEWKEDTRITSYYMNVEYDYMESEYVDVKAGDPMYWRIVRINGDGTIRLIYDGPTMAENGVKHYATIGSTAFNSSDSYTGYVYEEEVYNSETDSYDYTNKDSNIKLFVDAWYDKHLKSDYSVYIDENAIFCNDKSDINNDGKLDVSVRKSNNTPSLICINKNDRYSKNSEIGNGLLTNPIGLLTADEAIMSGGISATSKNFYLYSGIDYWSLSVQDSDSLYYVVEGRYLSATNPNNDMIGVRPVINLKADVQFTGNGTIDSPYQIVME